MSYLCYFCLFVYSGVKHILTICVTWRVSNKRQELLILREHLDWPRILVQSMLLLFLAFCVGVVFCFVCLRPVFLVVCPMLPVSLDCPLWPLFSHVNLQKLIEWQMFNAMWTSYFLMEWWSFVLDQYADLDIYCATLLKQ